MRGVLPPVSNKQNNLRLIAIAAALGAFTIAVTASEQLGYKSHGVGDIIFPSESQRPPVESGTVGTTSLPDVPAR
jgi:hypothetical protein